jgi:hypothetical protein
MDQEEVGLSLTAAAELTRRVGLRLSILGLTAFSGSGGEGPSLPVGLNASASVYATF